MIRVLADANVLVSAALARDPRAPSVLVLADDYLVALAHAANAEIVVTGDLDLLSVEEPGLSVMTPRNLVEHLNL